MKKLFIIISFCNFSINAQENIFYQVNIPDIEENFNFERLNYPDGCTDPKAINFSPYTNNNDGSCIYRTLGDINDDGEINIVDVVLMVNIILETVVPTENMLFNADYNSDGELNIVDIVLLVNFILNGSPEDPFEWIEIPAGVFTYGPNDEIRNIEYNYKIMKYNVTNQQFLNWMNQEFEAMDCSVVGSGVSCWFEGFIPIDEMNLFVPEGYYIFLLLESPIPEYNFTTIYWNGSELYVDEEYQNHPISGFNPAAMMKFASFYNADIPSQEEWEKAARGNTGYIYPFGDEISNQRCNYLDSGDLWDNGTTPVGFYNGLNQNTIDSPSQYGLYDMCGNIDDFLRDFNTGSNFFIFKARGGHFFDESNSNDLKTYNTTNAALWGFGTFNTWNMSVGFRLVKFD